jgi:hypothetical protein
MNTSSGQDYSARWTVEVPPDVVIQQITNAAATADGYSFQPSGPTSVVLTRKYWPMWLIIVVIVGTLLCLIGLLGLLYKETETLSVSASEEDGATVVNISGKGSTELIGRLNALLGSMPGAKQTVAPMPSAYPTPPIAAAPAAAVPPVPAPAPQASAPAPPPPPGAPADTSTGTPTSAGWHADPSGKHEYRYWNGTDWTDDVSDGGQQSTDTSR